MRSIEASRRYFSCITALKSQNFLGFGKVIRRRLGSFMASGLEKPSSVVHVSQELLSRLDNLQGSKAGTLEKLGG
jgi:hypothetical protein